MSSEQVDQVSGDQMLTIKMSLDTYLRNSEEEKFIKQFNNSLVKESCKDKEITIKYPTDPPVYSTFTYLQYCCYEGLIRAGICLISSGADLNKTTTNKKFWPPLKMASYRGYADLIGAILDKSPSIDPDLINNCLTYVIQNYRDFTYENADGNRSLCSIMEYTEKRNIDIISHKDVFGNTHLFYALLYANEEVALRILKKGALLCSRNRDFVTIEAANALVVEHHLKNCVSIKQETPKITATFNYETWILTSDENCETCETDGFFYMSNIDRFKHLLYSPLILCFLFMKWRKSRWFYYLHMLLNVINIILIGMFVVSVDNNLRISKYSFCFLSSILCLIRIIYRCVICYQYFRRGIYDFNISFKLAYSLIVLGILWVCASNDNMRNTKHKILLSLITVLESFEAVLLSRVMSYHGEMFKIVFINFCKVLLCYIILILAFSLGYHVIFRNESNGAVNDTFYKIFILLLGNADEGKYQESDFSDRMILLFFIFVFAIVFINLLNGLAVNEIGFLIQEAELVTLKETIHYIHSIEMLYLFFGKSYKLFKGKEKVLEGFINEHVLTETAGYLDWRRNNSWTKNIILKFDDYFNRIVDYSWTKDIILKLNELFPERRIFSCRIVTKQTDTKEESTNYV